MAAKRASLRVATAFLLAGIYLVLAGATTTDEITAAAATAVTAVVLAELLWRAGGRVLAFRDVAAGSVLATTLRNLGRDVIRVGIVLAARPSSAGAFVRQPYRGGGGDPADAAGLRAALVLAVSVTPGSYVVGVLRPRCELLVHRLPPPADRRP